MSTSPLLAPNDQDGMIRWLNDRVSALEQTAIIPVGLIAWVPGDVPNGWLACDGSSISNTRYGQLAAYLGTTTLPNMQGVVVVGKAAAGTFAVLGSTGGVEVVTLTAAQSGSPGGTTGAGSAHTHGASAGAGTAHQHSIPVATAAGGSAGNFVPPTNLTASGGNANTSAENVHTHAITVNSESAHTHSIGSSNAASSHTNLQPYIVLIPIIKV